MTHETSTGLNRRALQPVKSLPEAVALLLKMPTPYKVGQLRSDEFHHVYELLKEVTQGFVGAAEPKYAYQLHKTLNYLYDYQINAHGHAQQFDPVLMEIMLTLEEAWLKFERSRTPDVEFPDDPKEFIRWIKTWMLQHPSSDHPIFSYLAEECTKEEMSFFFSQEVTIDPRFDDLIALMQVGVSNIPIKLEFAANFWDEMGNGKFEEVHSVLFAQLYKELKIFKNGEYFQDVLERASWQALACGNTLLQSVLHRQNFNLALGALGTVEIISPLRFSNLVKGFNRLGLSADASEYHKAHISIDARHGNSWLHNAIMPTIEADPSARQEIFMGVMLRLNTSMDYCNFIGARLNEMQALSIAAA